MKNLFYVPITLIVGSIGYFIWAFTLKDYLPTPLPEKYKEVKILDKINMKGVIFGQKPVLLHFFSPECPCSRFNLDHVRTLAQKYQNQVDVRIVLQVEEANYDWRRLEKEIEMELPYLIDNTGILAESCGVYSTPQAVLLTSNQILYYRGNYNRARYCTDPKSNYTQMAIDSLLAGKSAPDFGLLATQAYGCELPTVQK